MCKMDTDSVVWVGGRLKRTTIKSTLIAKKKYGDGIELTATIHVPTSEETAPTVVKLVKHVVDKSTSLPTKQPAFPTNNVPNQTFKNMNAMIQHRFVLDAGEIGATKKVNLPNVTMRIAGTLRVVPLQAELGIKNSGDVSLLVLIREKPPLSTQNGQR